MFDPIPDVEPVPPPVEGVVVESMADLRVNKLTCLLSRSEPRDLVDLRNVFWIQRVLLAALNAIGDA